MVEICVGQFQYHRNRYANVSTVNVDCRLRGWIEGREDGSLTASNMSHRLQRIADLPVVAPPSL